jgi:hypothetical protein
VKKGEGRRTPFGKKKRRKIGLSTRFSQKHAMRLLLLKN